MWTFQGGELLVLCRRGCLPLPLDTLVPLPESQVQGDSVRSVLRVDLEGRER
jgi:hypothetical protein